MIIQSKKVAGGFLNSAEFPVVFIFVIASMCFSCSSERTRETSRAREIKESITVYTALTPLYGTDIIEDYYERYSDITGFDINVVKVYRENRTMGMYTKSWYALCQGPPAEYLDMLANLDTVINDVAEIWDYNPLRGKAEPDLIVSTIDDTYLIDKNDDDYFLPANEILADAPEFRVAHSDAFWEANATYDEYSIPLYSFQYDDAPAYWLIDAEVRSAFKETPIETFDELLEYVEFAAESAAADKPVVSTGQIPLGAIALHMKYGFLPVEYWYSTLMYGTYRTYRSNAEILGFATNVDLDKRVTSGTFLHEQRPNKRNLWFYNALAQVPLVRDLSEGRIRNVVSDPPQQFWDIVERICELKETRRLDNGRDDVAGLLGFLKGSIKALFIADDWGLSQLKMLMNRFPASYQSRFEVVPVSRTPLADLRSSFRIWVPKTTTKRREIAKWFDTIANIEVFEPIRYGMVQDSWQPVSDIAISGGDEGEIGEDCPAGFVMEVLARSGLPERVPDIVPKPLRGAFRFDDRETDSFIRLEANGVNIRAITGNTTAWTEFSERYERLLFGEADYVSTIDYLKARGDRLLPAIEEKVRDALFQ